MQSKHSRDKSTIANLYASWIFLRREIEPLLDPAVDVDEGVIDSKLEAIWAIEHAIASVKPREPRRCSA